MLKTLILGAALALTSTVALPASAEAQGWRDRDHRDSWRGRDGYRRDRWRDGRRYRHRSRHYRPRTRVVVNYAPGYYGYDPYYRGYSYDPYYRGYGYGYYPGRHYRGRPYYRSRYRCDDGTTGAIVGGSAGALIGREIGRDGGRYRRGRGDGTAGAIIGGAIGALIGREATRC